MRAQLSVRRPLHRKPTRRSFRETPARCPLPHTRRMQLTVPEAEGTDWIDTMPDDECAEVFWLYVDPPEPFLARYPPQLLGAAMRHALRAVFASAGQHLARRD